LRLGAEINPHGAADRQPGSRPYGNRPGGGSLIDELFVHQDFGDRVDFVVADQDRERREILVLSVLACLAL
jgi:hypothetical protein